MNDVGEWTRAFLDLEDRGWKKREAHVIEILSRRRGLVCKTIAGAAAAGELHLIRMDLGAPDCYARKLISAGAVYSLKICHDPEFDRYSPGVMIEIEAMKSFLNDPAFRFADSCAAPDHSMINGLWRARRIVTGLNVSGRGLAAKSALSLCRARKRPRPCEVIIMNSFEQASINAFAECYPPRSRACAMRWITRSSP
ncbi:MAG: hypothetical protein R3C58_04240 [Parvularculaceae bacterium]